MSKTKKSNDLQTIDSDDHIVDKSKKIGNILCDDAEIINCEETCKFIDILEMLAIGSPIPKIIELDGVIYKNASKDGLSMMYVSKGKNKNIFNSVLFLFEHVCDKEVLNREIKIIER